MGEEIRRAAEAEEMIQSIRERFLATDPEEASYRVAHDCFREKEYAEEDFSSDTVYRWYQTIRKTEYEVFVSRFNMELTVSVTSYPKRMEVLVQSLETIREQTRKPDHVILWLAEESFPGKEADLPEEIRRRAEKGQLAIRWCDDLKPHKKYFWILQENRDGLTVTVDDDLLYAPDMLEMLLLSYIRHPEAVSAMRVHLMAVAEGQKLLPYRNWVMETDAKADQPGMDLFATTGAGTLYPPGRLGKRFFDRQAIVDTCLMADDLWMKANEMMEGIPVALACRNRGLHFVPGSQDDTLWMTNRVKNDEQWMKIRELIDLREGEGALEKKLCEVRLEEYSDHAGRKADVMLERLKQVREELKQVRAEKNKEIRRLQEQLKQVRQDRNNMQAELDRIHGTIAYRIWAKTVKPIRKIFRK
jgi:hypothetical protein